MLRLLIVWIIAGGQLLSGCTDPHASGSAKANATNPGRNAVLAPSARYLLVHYDGDVLPRPLDRSGRSDCDRMLSAAWYELSGQSWSREIRVKSSCNGVESFRNSGRFERRGDTITFRAYDSTAKTTLVVDRGVFRGDTLSSGGRLFDGPPLLYVRERRE